MQSGEEEGNCDDGEADAHDGFVGAAVAEEEEGDSPNGREGQNPPGRVKKEVVHQKEGPSESGRSDILFENL